MQAIKCIYHWIKAREKMTQYHHYVKVSYYKKRFIAVRVLFKYLNANFEYICEFRINSFDYIISTPNVNLKKAWES